MASSPTPTSESEGSYICGIAGYYCFDGKYEKGLDIAFSIMALKMEERGNHAWGYTDGTTITKNNYALSDPGEFSSAMLGAPTAFIHTRFGTTGKNKRANAHPWNFGDGFIGCHNGMIYNHKDMNRKYQRNYPVDSQHILRHLKDGMALGELEGYGAVVYYKDGDLYIGRFNDGDMCAVLMDFGIMFASTMDALRTAINMSGMRDRISGWFTLEQGTLYKIKPDSNVLWTTDIKLDVGGDKASRYDRARTSGGVGSVTTFDAQGKVISSTTTGGDDYDWEDNRALGGELHADKCNWCQSWFMSGDSKHYCANEGFLCDTCADWYFSSDYDVAYNRLTGESLQSNATADAPYDTIKAKSLNDATHVVQCDGCPVFIIGDDDVYVDNINFDNLCLNCKDKRFNVAEQEDDEEGMSQWALELEARLKAEGAIDSEDDEGIAEFEMDMEEGRQHSLYNRVMEAEGTKLLKDVNDATEAGWHGHMVH